MGCDIHAMIERRATFFHPDEKEIGLYPWWVNCGDPEISRNYNVFGILAGVRNTEVASIAYPRGIPADACGEMRAWYQSWGQDAHSASYVTLAELSRYDAADMRERNLIDASDVSVLKSLIRMMRKHMKGMPSIEGIGGRHIRDEGLVRLVFFFDN